MAKDYDFLMQKSASGSQLKSSYDDFGFAVREIPWPDVETQEPAKREWPGEHGEDVYIPASGLKLQAYDLEVQFLYKGDTGTVYAKYKALRDYLIGAGGFLKIYDPYWKRGRQAVYARKFGELKPVRTNIDECLGIKVTFRVTDPVTDVVAAMNGDGEIINLGTV